MKHPNRLTPVALFIGTIALACTRAALAQVTVSDDFTQANDTNNWKTFNGACLTAGDGTGNIPACVGLAYYQGQTLYGGNSGTLPDPAGSGALRFTNGNNSGSGFSNGYNQAGSIISNFTFPTGAGLQVTFKTVTYRGNSGGSGKDGADGMSFFLMDGSKSPYDTGAFGGSLGYTCSNTNNDPTTRADGTTRGYDGLAGGYLGLGIDEYGNFLNGVSNTLGESGTTASGDNTASGGGYQPGRIGLRGAGSVSWGYLNSQYPTLFLSSWSLANQQAAVKNTCKSGYLTDYNNNKLKDATEATIPVADYAAISGGYKVLSGVKIANESAMKRGDAAPITYSLKITQDGLLSFSYSYNGGAFQPVITKQSITASNGALPASFRFGFAGSTGGSTNIHEIMCFQATPADLASTSVGVNAKEATKIASGTQAYLAYYYPSNWTGRLTASDLLYDSVNQVVSISTVANWDAQCNLTGVPAGQTCPTTLAPGLISAQDPTTRMIYTWTSSRGRQFLWASLSSADQNTLDAGDANPYNANRLNYIRGDRTNEVNTSGVGLFRAREGVLGDIVDSSPTWVGPPKSPYPSAWVDSINSSASLPENSGSQTYGQFVTSAGTRLNVVYAGSNDGMLHGFRSGAFDSTGNYVNNATYPNDGAEVMAYVPGAVLQTIHNSTDSTLDFSSTSYAHNFYVDATPGTDDLFYNGTWHTWLVGGLGAGGSAIYALDVTNPANFTTTNARSIVIGEWTPSTISCSNVSGCGSNMGNTYGVPVIRRLHDGMWAIIFGNGFGSSTGDAGIFVMTLNTSTGAVANTYYLSTGATGSNGIAYVSPADLDGDHITDYVYAGDLQGNIWRFDLTSSNESSWAASSSPLFTVPGNQPITTKLQLAIVPQTTGGPRLMIDFGTGRKFPQTTTSATSFLTSSQSLYGIWDWNMAAWNALAPAASRFASLAAPQSVTISTLQTQTLTTPVAGVRDVTSNPVCWAGSTTCSSGNTQFGWTIALPGSAEQVIFSPLMYQNAFIVNTTIPANNSPTSCTAATDTGYTIAVSVSSGGVLSGFFKNYNDTNAAGSQTNGTGTPFVVMVAGQSYLLTQSLGNGKANGPLKCTGKSCSGGLGNVGATGKRVTWIERR